MDDTGAFVCRHVYHFKASDADSLPKKAVSVLAKLVSLKQRSTAGMHSAESFQLSLVQV